jgi:hypothetical protein
MSHDGDASNSSARTAILVSSSTRWTGQGVTSDCPAGGASSKGIVFASCPETVRRVPPPNYSKWPPTDRLFARVVVEVKGRQQCLHRRRAGSFGNRPTLCQIVRQVLFRLFGSITY